MANIELVIKIPEELYNRFSHEYSEENLISKYTNDAILEAFCNGIPLPKGHGRLKDFDKIISDGRSKGFCDWYDEMKYAPTIIKADEGKE